MNRLGGLGEVIWKKVHPHYYLSEGFHHADPVFIGQDLKYIQKEDCPRLNPPTWSATWQTNFWHQNTKITLTAMGLLAQNFWLRILSGLIGSRCFIFLFPKRELQKVQKDGNWRMVRVSRLPSHMGSSSKGANPIRSGAEFADWLARSSQGSYQYDTNANGE